MSIYSSNRDKNAVKKQQYYGMYTPQSHVVILVLAAVGYVTVPSDSQYIKNLLISIIAFSSLSILLYQYTPIQFVSDVIILGLSSALYSSLPNGNGDQFGKIILSILVLSALSIVLKALILMYVLYLVY